MNREGDQLFPFPHWHDDEVEQDGAMDAGELVRFDDERVALALFKPGEGRFERGGREQWRVIQRADAQLIFRPAIAQATFMARLREVAREEPAKECGPFTVGMASASRLMASRIFGQSATAARTSVSVWRSDFSSARRPFASARSASI